MYSCCEGSARTWVPPAEKVEEEAVVICSSVRRDQGNLGAKHTGQWSVVCSSVLGHLAGVGEIGEFISSGIGLVDDALSSGTGRSVNILEVDDIP